MTDSQVSAERIENSSNSLGKFGRWLNPAGRARLQRPKQVDHLHVLEGYKVQLRDRPLASKPNAKSRRDPSAWPVPEYRDPRLNLDRAVVRKLSR